MQQGCLATPTTCRVIDSQRDLYITDRQLTRGGQWCISCFWPGICVLNSHGPPAGWHKADGSLRAAFLMGQGSVVSFSFSSATVRGWREKELKGQEKRRSKLDCVMCWNVTHVPEIPDSSHHPNTPLLDLGKLRTDSDIKTKICSKGIEWMTAEKQMNRLILRWLRS